jgi:hypothetical protein
MDRQGWPDYEEGDEGETYRFIALRMIEDREHEIKEKMMPNVNILMAGQ